MALKLDLKDRKILFELDKNSRITFSQLARKVRLSKEVVFHRLNNLIERKAILNFHTITSMYRFGYAIYKIYIRLQDISEEEYRSLYNYLLNNKDIFWFAESRGRWDLMIGVWAKNIEEFFSVHDKVIDKFSKFMHEKELSISRRNIQYNRRWMHDDGKGSVEFDFGEGESLIRQDKDDKNILDILASNSRMKIVDIARQTGLSPDVVSYRIKKMEKDGVIRGYKCLFNAKALGYTTCKAFIYLKNVTKERKRALLSRFSSHPNSVNTVITFAPWDLELMFEVENFEEFYQVMGELKNEFKDIIKFYEGILVTSEPKQVFR